MNSFTEWNTKSIELLCRECGSSHNLYELQDQIKCGECIAIMEYEELEYGKD